MSQPLPADADPTPGRRSVSEPAFDVVVEHDVMVTMRDGVRLATDLYRPAVDGRAVQEPLPVILHRTPYDKVAVERRWRYSEWFARRGYVAITQDVRGTFGSEGRMDFLVAEAADGADTLAWIGTQPWAGPVGSWGTSYASFTQLAMATQGPSNLKALVPNQSAADAWESSMRQGGAFELRFLGWALWHSATNTRADLRAEPWRSGALNFGTPKTRDWLTRLPIRRHETQLKLVPEYEDWVLRMITESDRTDYWRQPSLAPIRYVDDFPDDLDVLLMGAWYDSYPRATLELHEALSARGSGLVRTLVGPWVHGTAMPESPFAGNLDFGAHSVVPDLRELHLRWFDHTLKGLDTGVADEPPLRTFVMGGVGSYRTTAGRLFRGGAWRDLDQWPPPGCTPTPWYLHGDLTLSPESPDVEESATTYRFDPGKPVPSIGGSVSSLSDLREMPRYHVDTDTAGGSVRYANIMEPGGWDQVEGPDVFGATPPYLPLSSRPDVLAFRSEPLTEDLELSGPVEVRLWVSSSAPDTDFTAKLVDEHPPSPWYPLGYALNVTDGILRLRYRDGDTARLLPAGEVAEITIVLYPTSTIVAAGHRIRLDVSSSNFPRFDVNPNTGEPLGKERRRVVADNTVHHDALRCSHVVLPLVSP